MNDDEPDKAAVALMAMGRSVKPFGDDFALWLVDEFIVMTDAELVELVARAGVQAGSDRVH